MTQYIPARRDATPLAKYADMKVLIVESGSTNRCLATALLDRAGLTQIINTHTAAEALRECRRGGIDLVLLDMLLPDMDGLQLCGELAAETTIPVILMLTPDAAWRNNLGRTTDAAAGADVLFRPIHELELVPRVRRALELRREIVNREAFERDRLAADKQRRVLESRTRYLAGHDELTGLYNRGRLEEALDTALIDARAGHGDSALLYVDIDRFKLIRGFAGHAASDRFLRDIAAALRQAGGPRHLMAHVEGDEFAVLLRDTTPTIADEMAETIRRELTWLRFKSETGTYTVQSSIGIAAITAAESDHEKIVTQGRQASYVAKCRGGNLVHRFYENDAELINEKKMTYWAPLIRGALDEGRFRLQFQPVLRIADMRVDHYEVLVRMLDDGGELLSPAAFIPVAEQLGIIHEIDRWVICEAIEVLRRKTRDYPTLAFNINLSGRAFQDDRLIPSIRECLEDTGVQADRITFEITETAAIDNFDRTRDMVTQLRALGCRFALDDFGAGFASYSYLKEFPFDFLKIDGAFIANLVNDATDQVLVKSMVDVAQTLGKKTTAEFVGDRETLTLLGRYGVDHAQGYFIGRPDSAITFQLPPSLGGSAAETVKS